MSQKGNILKDTFYKERLLLSNQNTLYQAREADPEEESGLTTEEQQLDMSTILSCFEATACNTSYAYVCFTCTHKKLKAVRIVSQYSLLQRVDLSYNCLRTLNALSGLRHLTEIKAVNNQLTTVLGLKEPPLLLDTLDLSSNAIGAIGDLSAYVYLRVLRLRNNAIGAIAGFTSNKYLRVVDISENRLTGIANMDHLGVTELYLSSNSIETAKGLSRLEHLRVLDLSLNAISQLHGLMNLLTLRVLLLSKNTIAHVRQIKYLENLMYLTELQLCFNPLQHHKYYRMQILYRLPMLVSLDGSPVTKADVVHAEALYGLDVEEKYNIFKKQLPEEEFVDRRIHKAELIDQETDSEGEDNHFVDIYDEEGKRSHVSKQMTNRGFNASRQSAFSKQSKLSKKSSLSKQ